MTVLGEIRGYVKEKETVTLGEVVEYIIDNKGITTTESYIYQTLLKVLLEQNKTLYKGTLVDIVRKYVKEHGSKVSNEEVLEYVKKCKIKAKDNSVRLTLKRVLDETDGTLQHKGIAQLIRDYIQKTTTDAQSLEDVIKYVKKSKPKAKITTIKREFYRALKS